VCANAFKKEASRERESDRKSTTCDTIYVRVVRREYRKHESGRSSSVDCLYLEQTETLLENRVWIKSEKCITLIKTQFLCAVIEPAIKGNKKIVVLCRKNVE